MTHVHRYRFEERVEGQRYSTGACACGATTIGDNWAVEDMDFNWMKRNEYIKRTVGAKG